MKTHRGSDEIQLACILYSLANIQLQMPLIDTGLRELFQSLSWKQSSAKDKHRLLKEQFDKDFKEADTKQKLALMEMRKRVELALCA